MFRVKLTHKLDEPGQESAGTVLRQVTADNTDPPSQSRMAAEFIASDSSLFIYRRFGAFAAQRLAMMQLELSRLERQWRDLDNECKVRHDGEPENDYNERKRKLKRLGLDIGDKLERYRMSLRPLAKSLC